MGKRRTEKRDVSSSQTWTGSASGKVILLGEHAVVYGVPAIVVGIDRGARARVSAVNSSGEQAVAELVLGDTIRVTSDETSDVARAFAALLEACGIGSPVRIDVTTDLPAAAGLGCSAALGVAIVRALDVWQKRPLAPPNETIERALAWEKIFHGNPSGIDATAAARGGCLLYQRLENGPSLKEIRLGGPLSLAVGHTGTASSTRAMVDLVAKLRERRRDLVTQSFEGIASLVNNARLALEAHDRVGLGRLMDLNQMILSGLMLSTEEIETMCRLAREAGALGAKLTGSGGGGCVVALTGGDADPILASWEKAGFRCFSTTVAPELAAAAEHREAP
jgi:mevalonate kinase